METLVAITYISASAQGNELSLAVEGWRRHFKEPHRILIVGDKPPVEDVDWLDIPRVPKRNGQYLPALDICAKLEAVCLYCMDKGIAEFVWASDDFFAVNDFSLPDVKYPKYYMDEMLSRWDRTQNEFEHTQIKTRRLCEREGFGVTDWTTHLPMWMDAEKLYWVIQDYNLTEDAQIVENIYYNKFGPKGKPFKLHAGDRFKYPVRYRTQDLPGLEDAFINKIWICCSEAGWSEELERELRRHYGIE